MFNKILHQFQTHFAVTTTMEYYKNPCSESNFTHNKLAKSHQKVKNVSSYENIK